MSTAQVFRTTLVVMVTVLLAYIVYNSIHILIVLLVAIIIASALRPMVVWLAHRRLGYGGGAIVVYGLVTLALFALSVLIIPPITSQLSGYVTNEKILPNKLYGAEVALINAVSPIIGNQTISGVQTSPPTPSINSGSTSLTAPNTTNPVPAMTPPVTLDQITKATTDGINQVIAALPNLAGAFGSLLGDFILVLVMGIYWLTARDQSLQFLMDLFPMGKQSMIDEMMVEIEHSLGTYTRGVIMVATFVGVANFIILRLFNVPDAATLGFIIGITTILPLIGGYIGAGGAVFLALLTSPVNALIALGSFVAVQQVENHYLTPRVMSRSVGLNPLLVIVLLFVGFDLGGVVGGLISVPVAGAIMIMLRHLVIDPRKNESKPHIIEGGILLESRESTDKTSVVVSAPAPTASPTGEGVIQVAHR